MRRVTIDRPYPGPAGDPTGTGFIVLSGVTVLSGLVMMSAIRKHREDGDDECGFR